MPRLGEKARKLLEAKNFVFIATLNKDGSPHLTPVWVDTDGENVLINTAVGRKKTRNIARDERVAVGVFDYANPYEHLTIQGKVSKLVKGKEAEAHIDRLAKKYLGKNTYPWRSPSEKRVILVIKPLKVY